MIAYTPEDINRLYPITGLEFFTQGIRLIRSSERTTKQPHGRRGMIMELSKTSLSRLAFLAQNTPLNLRSMMTLTYGAIYPNDGVLVKKALNRFLSFLRTRYTDLGYIWFMEFQTRGAPHLHILLDISVIDGDRNIVASRWLISALEAATHHRDAEAWQMAETALKMYRVHKHRRMWEELRSEGGGRGYVTKYASKPKQKTVPSRFANVGRFWGNSRNAKPRPLSKQSATDRGVRLYLEATGHKVADAKVLPRHISTYNPESEDTTKLEPPTE